MFFWNSKLDIKVKPKLIKTLCIFKIVLMKIKGFFYKIHIWLSKNNWHMSKNRNFYNPIIGATVYKWGANWNIARHNIHYEGYQSKTGAMEVAFEMWLQEKQDNQIISKNE